MTQRIIQVNPDVATLDDAVVRANLLKAVFNLHLADDTVHSAADATNPTTEPDASNQGTLNTLLNALKVDLNAHRVEAGVHPTDDTVNVVSAADASNLATSLTLMNQLASLYNRHRIDDQISHISADRTNQLRTDTLLAAKNTTKNFMMFQIRAGSNDLYLVYSDVGQMAEAPGSGNGTGIKMVAESNWPHAVSVAKQFPWYATCESGDSAVVLVVEIE